MVAARRPPNPSLVAAASAVQSAAKLMRHCDGIWRDERDGSSDWQIDYAVDVDVIALYSDPTANSSYASVFDQDKETGCENLLARMLGEFILREVNGFPRDKKHGSLLIIPPHDEEYERMRLAILNKVFHQADQVINRIDQTLGVVLAAAKNHPLDDQAIIGLLVEHVKELVESFDEKSGPRLELHRLNFLPKSKIRNISRIEHYAGGHGSPRFLPPSVAIASDDRNQFTALVGQWRKRLRAHQFGYKPAYALLGDAIVLATLEWINQHAAKHRRRLVLITGSPYLFAAGEEVRIEGQTFAYWYLRHPLAFVGSEHFFRVGNLTAKQPKQPKQPVKRQTEFRLHDWLNLFFPSVLKQRGSVGTVNHDVLRSIEAGKAHDLTRIIALFARHEHERHGRKGFPTMLLAEWTDVIKGTAAYRGFADTNQTWQSRINEFMVDFNKRLDAGWTVKSIKEHLVRHIEGSIGALYLSTSVLGVMQLRDGISTVRGLPALRFDPAYQQAQVACDELINKIFSVGAEFDFGALYESLYELDDSHYHAHLIHALAYAGKGHWHATLTLCRFALTIIESMKQEEQKGRVGREASYLLAIAERRLAGKVEDLEPARKALRDAIKRQNQETCLDVRFRSEQFALDVTTIQFSFFDNMNKKTHGFDLQERLRDAQQILELAEKEPVKTIRKWVVRQMVTNALILGLIAKINTEEPLNESVIQSLNNLTALLKSEGLVEDSSEPSLPERRSFTDSLSDFIYWCAVGVFDSDQERRAFAKSKVSQIKYLGQPSVPFEEEREKAFRRLLGA